MRVTVLERSTPSDYDVSAVLAWMDNIKPWTGLHVEESIRMTEDRDKYGVANPRIEDG